MDKRASTLVTLGFAALCALGIASFLLSSPLLGGLVAGLAAVAALISALQGGKGTAPSTSAPPAQTNEIASLQEQLQAAQAKAAAADEALHSARAELGRAHAETAEAQAKVSLAAEAAAEAETASRRAAAAEAEAASAQQREQELQARLNAAVSEQNELQSVQQALAAAQGDAAELRSRLAAAEAELARALQQASDTAARLDAASADHSLLQAAEQRAQAAEEAARAADERAREAQAGSAAAEQRLAAAERAAQEARSQAEGGGAAVAAAQARVAALEADLAHANTRAEAAEAAAQAAQQRASNAETAAEAANARASAAVAAASAAPQASATQPLQVSGFADEDDGSSLTALPAETVLAEVLLADAEPDPAGFVPRVLVVDDNATSQMIAVMMLRDLGCEVELAASGSEAVNKAQAGEYDMVFIDMSLPGVSGLDATAALRRNDLTDLPIIAMVGSAAATEACLEAGMNDCLIKPLQQQGFADMLQRWTPFSGAIGLDDEIPSVTATLIPSAPFTAIDTQTLAHLRRVADSSEGAMLQQIFASYLQDGSARLQHLRNTCAANDLQAVVVHSHALKGASLNIGAMQVARLSEQLEQQARAGSLLEPQAVLQQLEREFERVRNSVRALNEEQL